jgi:hypothetical protein
MKMKVGDLVRSMNGPQKLVPKEMKAYPITQMRGIIVEIQPLRCNTRSATNGGMKPDPVVLWESGAICSIHNGNVEVISESR